MDGARKGCRSRRLAAILVACAGSAASASTIYVNAAATGTGNGTSWANAYTSLQPALTAATTGDQIWVAQGTYKPAGPGGNRAASFLLKTGVAVYGGFLGGETQLTGRDWDAHPTILSGDLNGNDGPEFANTAENSYHVVVALDTDDTAVLDGFSIVAGRADGPGFGAVPESQDQGSGLNVYFSTPHIENCTFERNWAGNHGTINDHGSSTVIHSTFRANHSEHFGAGLYCHHESATVARDCTFVNNEAVESGGGYYSRSFGGAVLEDSTFTGNHAAQGAAAYNAPDATTAITNCLFTANEAVNGGAGVYNDLSSPSINGCIFTENAAGTGITSGGGGGGGSGGGGVWNNGGAAVIADCGFYGNLASFGGGVYSIEDSHAMVLGCVFDGNSAREAGGFYTLSSPTTAALCAFRNNTATGGAFSVGGGVSTYFSDAIVRDCEFTGNQADLGGGGMYCEGAAPVVTKCRFIGNRALGLPEGWGGGLLIGYNAAAAVRNCIFFGNQAHRGGAIFSIILSTPVLSACTILSNTAILGGGVLTFDGITETIAGSIIWGNSPTQLEGGPPTVVRCCVQGGADGVGNLAADPRFVRLPSPGPDGIWGTSDDDHGDLRLSPGSLCIDAGDNAFIPADLTADPNGDPRRADDPGTPNSGGGTAPIVDIGAYEFQGSSCYANCDASTIAPILNVNDFTCFLNRFQSGLGWANCDGSTTAPTMNVLDFQCFLNRFAAGCS